MPDLEQQLEIIKNTYAIESIPSLIPEETSLNIGRILIENNYKMVGGWAFVVPSKMSVGSILKSLDTESRYKKATEIDLKSNNRLIGPNLSIKDDKMVLFLGIGIWEISEK